MPKRRATLKIISSFTQKFHDVTTVLSRLNEMSGGRGNLCLVSVSLQRILKFLRMAFLSARFVDDRRG